MSASGFQKIIRRLENRVSESSSIMREFQVTSCPLFMPIRPLPWMNRRMLDSRRRCESHSECMDLYEWRLLPCEESHRPPVCDITSLAGLLTALGGCLILSKQKCGHKYKIHFYIWHLHSLLWVNVKCLCSFTLKILLLKFFSIKTAFFLNSLCNDVWGRLWCRSLNKQIINLSLTLTMIALL